MNLYTGRSVLANSMGTGQNLIQQLDVARRNAGRSFSPPQDERAYWENLHAGNHTRKHEGRNVRPPYITPNNTRLITCRRFVASPKQDHLVCFLGGTLMLGATTTGALVSPVSVPPKKEELTPEGQRDWKTGYELVETCMDTHRMST